MNTERNNDTRSLAACGRVLGVLGLFLFNFVVAPCALALGADHECSHCPPEQTAEMAAHHGHVGGMDAAGCDTLTSDCDDAGSMAHEGRSAQLKPKGDAEPAAMPAPAFPHASPDIAVVVTTASGPPEPDGFSPPLHLLNCVFLD